MLSLLRVKSKLRISRTPFLSAVKLLLRKTQLMFWSALNTTTRNSFGYLSAPRPISSPHLLNIELHSWVMLRKLVALTQRDLTATRLPRTRSVTHLTWMTRSLSWSTAELCRISMPLSGARLTSSLSWSRIKHKVSKIFNIGLNMLLISVSHTKFLFTTTWTSLPTTTLTCGASSLSSSTWSTDSLNLSCALFCAAAARRVTSPRSRKSRTNELFQRRNKNQKFLFDPIWTRFKMSD